MAAYTHIMLADDDKDDIELFQSAVEECAPRLRVSTAENGKRLIELLEAKPLPDVIIMDLNMPYMSGFDCLKRIRKNNKYKEIPIMIYSTSTSPADIEYCLQNGADYYVVKPGSFNAIERIVDDLNNGVVHNRFDKWH